MIAARRLVIAAAVVGIGGLAIGIVRLRPAAEARPSTSPPSGIDEQLASARKAGRPAVIVFSADWCAACRVLENKTLRDATVAHELERFDRIKVDATDQEAVAGTLARFGVEVFPVIIFVTSKGELLETARVTGTITPALLLDRLREIR